VEIKAARRPADPAHLTDSCRAAPSAPIWLGVGAWNKSRVAIRTREIYRSVNGDRWLLASDPDTGRVFVRHEPNLPSGGQVADIEIGAFLIAAGNGPEKQELLRLIGTLVKGPAVTRP
jgi:hypothetical protein